MGLRPLVASTGNRGKTRRRRHFLIFQRILYGFATWFSHCVLERIPLGIACKEKSMNTRQLDEEAIFEQVREIDDYGARREYLDRACDRSRPSNTADGMDMDCADPHRWPERGRGPFSSWHRRFSFEGLTWAVQAAGRLIH